ncbi:MAG: rRNA maturation RNase YbeY [Alphaproteobacteria bacterium]
MQKNSEKLYVELTSPLWEKYQGMVIPSIRIITNICFMSEKELGFPCLKGVPDNRELGFYVTLADDAEVTKMNYRWRYKNQPTNILSFPNFDNQGSFTFPPEGIIPFGDLILAFETIEKEAKQAGLLLMDHVNRLVIHGLFHLFGYNHVEDDDFFAMRRREMEALALAGIQKTADMGYISLD